MTRHPLLSRIEQLLGCTLHSAPERPGDPLGALMAFKADTPKYLLAGDTLLGLNLARTGLTDAQWQTISQWPEFQSAPLQALNLSENELKEVRIPDEMQALRWLDVSDNKALAQVSLPDQLPNLTRLKIRGSQIKSWNLAGTFPRLAFLDLSGGHLQRLQLPADLGALQHLYLSQNRLVELNLPKGLNALSHCYLRGNQLKKLKIAGKLPVLQCLDLRENRLEDFSEGLLDHLPQLDLLLAGNPLPDAMKGFIDQRSNHSCLDFLQNTYYPDLRKGTAIDRECKVLVIGNGGVGKSVLVKRLIEGEFEADWHSTHAITIAQYDQPDCKYVLNLWDFGGQDIYHATHRLFMQSSAVYLVLWDQLTEQKTSSPLKEQGITREYENFLLPYWLHYAQVLGKNSPAIVTQTKVGWQQENKELRRDIQDTYRPFGFAYVETENLDWEDSGYEDLLAKIQRAVRRIKPWVEIPANWIALRDELRRRQQANEKYLSFADYQELAKAQQVEAPIGILENWLVKTGVVFYREGLFRHQIILDQEWAIQAVYTLFDREGHYFRLKEQGGVFTGEDLQQIWQSYEGQDGGIIPYEDRERELFVSFMLSCDICFEKKEKEETHRSLPFPLRTFIAPQLLPDKMPKSVRRFWLKREALFFRYTHDFLHYGVIQSFIIRTQELAETDEIWKNGIMLFEEEEVALVESLRLERGRTPYNVIQIQVTLGGQALLGKIRDLIEKLQDSPGRESLSLDGENYVGLEQLQKHNPQESATILSESGTYLPYEPLRVFLATEKSQSFASLSSPEPQMKDMPDPQPKRKKVFVSYARKEDHRYMKYFVEGIKAHSDWEIVDDRCILLGEDWHERLQKEVQSCDLGILLLSPYFFKSDYIRDHEMEHFVSRNVETGFPIFSVLLSDCDFRQWPEVALRQFFSAEGQDYDLGKSHRDEQISFDLLARFDRDGELIPNAYLHTFYKNFVAKAKAALYH